MALTKKQIEQLKEIHRFSTFEFARFRAPEKWPCPGNWPERDKDFTEAVVKATQLYRETWILPLLEELIDSEAHGN